MAAAGAAVRAAEFDRLGSTVHLNAAAYAPLPERSVRVARHLDERRAAAALELDQLAAGLARARQACATLIGADAAEVALTPSTSAGLNVGADIVRQPAFHDLAALAHSVELIVEVGPTAILEHVRALHQPLLEWAAAGWAEAVVADPAHGSAILAVNVPDAYAIHNALARADIICAPREGALRFAPHLYNTAEDMERVVEVLLATVH